jgi:hypothetical protein
MKEYPFIITVPQDTVFERVKAETSMYGIRSTDKEGNSMFEALVLDEPNIPILRAYLQSGHAEVEMMLSAYTAFGPDRSFLDVPNAERRAADLNITLAMPENWNERVYRSLCQAVLDYLVYYVLLRWYETKDANIAGLYAARVEDRRNAIGGYVNFRKAPLFHHTQLY